MLKLREPLHITPRPDSWPRGIECVLHYGDQAQWTLNDQRRVDAIIVDAIGGLGGPDLATAAEKNADRDGETPNDANHGGRTVTLRGYVRAGNLEMMRHLISYVESAFDEIREQPLWMRWLDWRDVFQDSEALIDYVRDINNATPITIASDGSGLVAPVGVPTSISVAPKDSYGQIPSRLTYGDGEITTSFYAGASLTGLEIGVEGRRTYSTDKIRVVYENAAQLIKIYKISSGITTLLASSSTAALTVGIVHYLRARFEADVITYSIWSVPPPDVGGTPLISGTFTLSAGDYVLFPASTSGSTWGLYWKPNGATDRVQTLDVGAINKGDAIIMCRKAVPIDLSDEQTDDRFRRSFMITLRASSSVMVSRKTTTFSAVPSSFALTFPAGGGGLTFPADGSGLVFGSYLPGTIVNKGRSPADMIVRFYGQMTNPVVVHPITGKSLGYLGTITAGDYVEFDTSRRTVVNSAGTSVYGSITDQTSWPQLLPGSNRLVIGADLAPSGSIQVVYRHSSR